MAECLIISFHGSTFIVLNFCLFDKHLHGTFYIPATTLNSLCSVITLQIENAISQKVQNALKELGYNLVAKCLPSICKAFGFNPH